MLSACRNKFNSALHDSVEVDLAIDSSATIIELQFNGLTVDC